MPSRKKKRAKRDKSDEKAALRAAQVELVKLQRHVIETEQQVLVIFEGRDAAGKDGTIKRIAQHLSPRETRVVALGPPSDRPALHRAFAGGRRDRAVQPELVQPRGRRAGDGILLGR